MTSSKDMCRLCLMEVEKDALEPITDDTIHISEILLIKLQEDKTDNPVICTMCSRKLSAAYDFKSTCIHTDNVIIPYIDFENQSQLDLKNIYLNERDNKEAVMLTEDKKVCRLCLELTGKIFVPLQKMDLDMLQKFFPEINLDIIQDPVVCISCFDSFATHSIFLKTCLDAQEGIKNPGQYEKSGHKDQSSVESFIKTEIVDIKSENRIPDTSNIELIQFKKEIEETELIQTEESKLCDNDRYSDNVPTSEIGRKYICANECNGKRRGQCKPDLAQYKKKFKYSRKTQQHLVHMNSTQACEDPLQSQMHKCDVCDIKAMQDLESHQITHKDLFQVQRNELDFGREELLLKIDLKVQELNHQDVSKVQLHGSEVCDYTNKQKLPSKIHHSRCRKPLIVYTHKCDVCDYETGRKWCLNKHQLIHKDPSQIQIHRCDICAFETKLPGALRKHQLLHKDPAQVQMYECNICTYATKFSGGLKRHQLLHKDPSQVPMYICDTCKFATKFQGDLKRHQLIHKDSSQVQMYRCDVCVYKTKLKGALKQHQLKHKDPSQVQMYECDVCKYATKFKGVLKRHQLKHKDPSQVQMLKCDICDYQTKFKDILKKHHLVHKSPYEVQMHKCGICDYRTKYKAYLKKHQLLHKGPS